MTRHYQSQQASPAAPVLEITALTPDRVRRKTLLALVDSGADCTVLPEDLLADIGAFPFRTRRVKGVTAKPPEEWEEWNVYLLFVEVEGAPVGDLIEVAADPRGDEALIGRDVLNRLVLELNGPAQITSIIS